MSRTSVRIIPVIYPRSRGVDGGKMLLPAESAFSRCPNLSLATRLWRGDWTSVPVVAIATGSSPSQETPPPFAVYVFLCFSSSPFFVFPSSSCCLVFLILPLFRCLYVHIRNQSSGRDVFAILLMVSKGRFNCLTWVCRK